MNLRIVMPSIIDPVIHRGGAGATTAARIIQRHYAIMWTPAETITDPRRT